MCRGIQWLRKPCRTKLSNVCCLLINQNYTIEKCAVGWRFNEKGLVCWTQFEIISTKIHLSAIKQLTSLCNIEVFFENGLIFQTPRCNDLKPWSHVFIKPWLLLHRFFNVINVRPNKKTENQKKRTGEKDNFVWFWLIDNGVCIFLQW